MELCNGNRFDHEHLRIYQGTIAFLTGSNLVWRRLARTLTRTRLSLL